MAENLQAFTARCPGDVSVYSYPEYVDDPKVLAEQTAKFRAAVEARSTVGEAAVYVNLWTAEFRVESPKNFDRLRAQVREDMKRIRELDPKNTNQSKSLIHGYRLIGDTASADELQAKRAPVKSFTDVFVEWDKAHPFPKDQDPAAIEKRQEEMLTASAQWVKDWPEETNAWYWRMLAIASHKGSVPEEIEKAGEVVLASDAKAFRSWSSVPYPASVAQVWAEHDIRLKDCVELLHQGLRQMEGGGGDDRLPGPPAGIERNFAIERFAIWGTESLVDRKLGQYDAASCSGGNGNLDRRSPGRFGLAENGMARRVGSARGCGRPQAGRPHAVPAGISAQGVENAGSGVMGRPGPRSGRFRRMVEAS